MSSNAIRRRGCVGLANGTWRTLFYGASIGSISKSPRRGAERTFIMVLFRLGAKTASKPEERVEGDANAAVVPYAGLMTSQTYQTYRNTRICRAER